jgi:hypothetical protein
MQRCSINYLKYRLTCTKNSLSVNESKGSAALDSLCAAISLLLYVARNWTALQQARPNKREPHQSCCRGETVRLSAGEAETGKQQCEVCSCEVLMKCSAELEPYIPVGGVFHSYGDLGLRN